MNRQFNLFLAITLLLLTSACSTINQTLKADPIQNTAFADAALKEAGEAVQAAPARSYPFHRVWRVGAQDVQLGLGEPVYVAPVDISRLSLAGVGSGVRPHDAEKLAEYLRRAVEEQLKSRSFDVVAERPMAGRVIELALVEVSSTDVARNVFGTAIGAVVPFGGLISVGSSGSTAIEGVVRDAATGRPLFIFADRERGKIAPFSLNDFTKYSHAHDAMVDWAEQIVKACAMPFGARIGESFRITLLPL